MPIGANLADGIRFNDSMFSEPSPLAGWTPPKCAGLFGILTEDPNWAPKRFRPLYFGEFGNNASSAALDYHRLVAAAEGKQLLVSVCQMPFSTSAQRFTLRDELIAAYNPVCQVQAVGSAMKPLIESRRRIGFMPQTDPAT
jgi:hypothetical protein